jgi:cold shock CspA family protein
MGRSQETFGKKEVRNKKEKKRKEKEEKRAKKKTEGKKNTFDDMIAYVNEFGVITSTPPDPDKKVTVAAESIELKISKNSPEAAPDFIRQGVVTYFNKSKGFGFIRDMESNQRVFVHANSLLEPVIDNDIVTYELAKGPKGPAAIKVKLLKQ